MYIHTLCTYILWLGLSVVWTYKSYGVKIVDQVLRSQSPPIPSCELWSEELESTGRLSIQATVSSYPKPGALERKIQQGWRNEILAIARSVTCTHWERRERIIFITP